MNVYVYVMNVYVYAVANRWCVCVIETYKRFINYLKVNKEEDDLPCLWISADFRHKYAFFLRRVFCTFDEVLLITVS